MPQVSSENILWVGLLLAFIFVSNYLTHVFGKQFYESQTNNGKIFDILHEITPDLHDYRAYNDIILGLTIVSFFFVPFTLIQEFLGKFILIMFVRALTIVSTILPKHEKCEPKLDWIQMVKGQCYDKVFSGHTAFVLLATLIFLREGIIGLPMFFLVNLLNMTSIILTRSHYTIDIILAVVITYLVYDGDYHVFTNFTKEFMKNVGKK